MLSEVPPQQPQQAIVTSVIMPSLVLAKAYGEATIIDTASATPSTTKIRTSMYDQNGNMICGRTRITMNMATNSYVLPRDTLIHWQRRLTIAQALAPDPSDPSNPELTERENLETELIRRLISSYFNIVRESIADQVPKAVMHLLVNHSKDGVQNRLVSELYKEDLFGDLLYEDDGIKAEREKCEKLLGTYREAAKIVGEVL